MNPTFIIPAEAYTDDQEVVVEFDALPWFRQASVYDIAKLANCNWGSAYPADNVAEFCANRDSSVQRLFDYLKVVNQPETTCGFDCQVDEEAALKWLQTRSGRRPPINPDAKMTYRHTLMDNSGHGGPAEIVFEADGSWASIAVWNNGDHLADVTVELYEGELVARTWKTEDIDGDPTTRTVLCRNPVSKVIEQKSSEE